MEIKFTKLVANGNDFVAIDNRSHSFTGKGEELAKHICNRRTGVGADGLLMLEYDGEIRMRVFNPDGSEADMCGNGSRCFAKYVTCLGLAKKKIVFSTLAGLQTVIEEGDSSKLIVGGVVEDQAFSERIVQNLLLEEVGGCSPLGFIRVAVPHCVIEVGDCKSFAIEKIGPIVRYSKVFEPEGTNVIFFERISNSHLAVRAWEKGVEGETFGCGTGAIAACKLIADELVFPVIVEMSGGNMIVDREEDSYSFSGGVAVCFTGSITIER